eukprot:UN06487
MRIKIIVILVLSVDIYYNGCDAKACTCRVSNQAECETAGYLKYDNDGNIKTQCSWDVSHNKCRNTLWLECKQDPKCIWIHKVGDDMQDKSPADIDDPCSISEQGDNDQQDDDIIFVYSSDGDRNQNDEIKISSMQTQSDNIRIFSFCIVLIFGIGGCIYQFLHVARKNDVILSAFNKYQGYSTF